MLSDKKYILEISKISKKAAAKHNENETVRIMTAPPPNGDDDDEERGESHTILGEMGPNFDIMSHAVESLELFQLDTNFKIKDSLSRLLADHRGVEIYKSLSPFKACFGIGKCFPPKKTTLDIMVSIGEYLHKPVQTEFKINNIIVGDHEELGQTD